MGCQDTSFFIKIIIYMYNTSYFNTSEVTMSILLSFVQHSCVSPVIFKSIFFLLFHKLLTHNLVSTEHYERHFISINRPTGTSINSKGYCIINLYDYRVLWNKFLRLVIHVGNIYCFSIKPKLEPNVVLSKI